MPNNLNDIRLGIFKNGKCRISNIDQATAKMMRNLLTHIFFLINRR